MAEGPKPIAFEKIQLFKDGDPAAGRRLRVESIAVVGSRDRFEPQSSIALKVILAQDALVFREEPIDAVPDLSFVERIGTFGRNLLQSSRQVWLLENLPRLRDAATRQEYRCRGRKL